MPRFLMFIVNWLGDPELTYNDDFALSLANNMTLACTDWSFLNKFSTCWGLGTFQQRWGGGGLPSGPPSSPLHSSKSGGRGGLGGDTRCGGGSSCHLRTLCTFHFVASVCQ